MSNSDDVVAELSSKLLLGWCMLDAHCGECGSPLMRDRDNKNYCCGCKVYVNENRMPLREEAKRNEVPEEPFVAQNDRVSETNEYIKGLLESKMRSLAERLTRTEGMQESDDIIEVIKKCNSLKKELV
mgnify:CR=1 FL=1